MPKINIESSSNLSLQEAVSRVKEMFTNDRDLKKIDPSYTVEFNESSGKGVVKGSKFSAAVTVLDNKVEVVVDIPLLLSPFKGQIKNGLEEKLAKALA